MTKLLDQSKQSGFTLIELVVVIVILGILAATAVPKFINLKASAQTSVLEAIKGSMDGAAALVYGKALVKGIHELDAGAGQTVNIGDPDGNGTDNEIVVNYGYPQDVIDDWKALIELDEDEFDIVLSIAGQIIIYFKEHGVPTDLSDPCIIIYTEASSGSPYTVSVTPCE